MKYGKEVATDWPLKSCRVKLMGKENRRFYSRFGIFLWNFAWFFLLKIQTLKCLNLKTITHLRYCKWNLLTRLGAVGIFYKLWFHDIIACDRLILQRQYFLNQAKFICSKLHSEADCVWSRELALMTLKAPSDKSCTFVAHNILALRKAQASNIFISCVCYFSGYHPEKVLATARLPSSMAMPKQRCLRVRWVRHGHRIDFSHLPR